MNTRRGLRLITRRRAKLLRREHGGGDMLPYARHVDDVTIATRDGLLIQFLYLDGFPFETADSSELNYRQSVRETMLRSIASSHFAVYHHVVRREVTPELDGKFGIPSHDRSTGNGGNASEPDVFIPTICFSASFAVRFREGRAGWMDLSVPRRRTTLSSEPAQNGNWMPRRERSCHPCSLMVSAFSPLMKARTDCAPSRWNFSPAFTTGNFARLEFLLAMRAVQSHIAA